jgi:hypothetical protein
LPKFLVENCRVRLSISYIFHTNWIFSIKFGNNFFFWKKSYNILKKIQLTINVFQPWLYSPSTWMLFIMWFWTAKKKFFQTYYVIFYIFTLQPQVSSLVYEAGSQEGWVFLMYDAIDSLPTELALIYFISLHCSHKFLHCIWGWITRRLGVFNVRCYRQSTNRAGSHIFYIFDISNGLASQGNFKEKPVSF